jgi:carboxymethylenebutenolidase
MDAHSVSSVDRRSLLKGAAAGVVGAGVAVAVPPAEAQNKNAVKDPGIIAEAVTFKSGDADISGFLARPKEAGKRGAVILIPGIFGLTDYMKEITAQVATAGLVGLAVEWYSRNGGTPKTNDFAELRQIVGQISDKQRLGDLQAGIDHLKKQPYANGKYGVTGFCMGGKYALLFAATSPDIVAAAPYYGPVMSQGADRRAPIDEAGKIKAVVQGHYGATDQGIKADDVRAYFDKLRQTSPHSEVFIYEGAGHAFHDFSRPAFNPDAAKTAWDRTLKFFQDNLK